MQPFLFSAAAARRSAFASLSALAYAPMGHRAARGARGRKNATRSCMHTHMSLRLTYCSLPFFPCGSRARGYTALVLLINKPSP